MGLLSDKQINDIMYTNGTAAQTSNWGKEINQQDAKQAEEQVQGLGQTLIDTSEGLMKDLIDQGTDFNALPSLEDLTQDELQQILDTLFPEDNGGGAWSISNTDSTGTDNWSAGTPPFINAGGGEGKTWVMAGGSGGDAGGYVYRNGKLTRVRSRDVEHIRRMEANGTPVPGYSLTSPELPGPFIL